MTRTLVVGGGFAGLAAATALADRGHQVTLAERRAFLGGKACSYFDPEAGYALDNGQHAFLWGYRNTRKLLRRWGSEDLLGFPPTLDLSFRLGEVEAPFRCVKMPAPFHLLWPLATFRALPWQDRLAMVRPAWSLLSMSQGDRLKLEGVRFADWLKFHGQSERSLQVFWEVLSLAAINGSAERISAYPAMQVLSQGFLGASQASRFGYAKRALSSLYARFPNYLSDRGGALLLGHGVRALRAGVDAPWLATFHDGQELGFDAAILAVPPGHLSKLLPSELQDRPWFRDAAILRQAPIVSVQLTLDRPIPLRPVTALLDSPLHWIFHAGALREDAPSGALSLVVSGAHAWAGRSREAIAAIALAELKRFFPAAQDARILSCRVFKELEATLDCLPGSEALRPSAITGVSGLYLAGAWTATSLPSTVEGAVMSGLKAVEVLEAANGRSCALVETLDRSDPLIHLFRGINLLSKAIGSIAR